MSDVRAGSRLGAWTLVRELPGGRSGCRVFEARADDERRAALKLHPASAERAAAREAAAARSVDHPSLPRLLDRGTRPAPWIALSWHEAETLDAAAPPGEVAPARGAEILREILAALGHLHERGFVHGDLSPTNVLIDDDGRVLLADLGAAVPIDSREAQSAGGSPAWMAPERIEGAPASVAADLFAAGALILECVAGTDALQRLRSDEGEPSGTALEEPLASTLDEPLASTLDALLRRSPDERPGDAAEAIARLDGSAGTIEPVASDEPTGPTKDGALSVPPLVGRSAILEHWDEVVARTRGGDGDFVVVRGEAGIGRSRLLDELARRARRADCRVLSTRCRPAAPPSQGPWRDLLAALASELAGADAGEIADLVGPEGKALAFLCPEIASLDYLRTLPEPPDLSPDLNKFRIFSAATSLLRGVSRERPTLIILDDAHAADDAAVELTYYVLRNVARLEDGALTVALGVREGETSELFERTLDDARRAGGWAEVHPQRLSPDEIADLVAGMLPGAPVPTELGRLVAAESGGHPGEAVELVAALVDEGLLRRTRAGWHLASPETTAGRLGDVLRRRLDRVGEAARRLLEARAVLRVGSEGGIAAAAAGLDEDAAREAVRELREARLIAGSDEPGAGIPHEPLRALVLADLDEPQRRSLHRRAAESLLALRRQDAAAVSESQLATHFLEAGDAEAALDWLPGAAREAQSAGNLAEALERLNAGVAQAEHLPRRQRERRSAELLALRQSLGELLVRLGRFDEAVDCFLDLLGSCRGVGDAAAEARALVGLGHAENLRGDYDAAREHLESALEGADAARAPTTAARARVLLIQNAYLHGDFERGEPHVERVRADLDALGDRALAAETLRQVGLFHHFRGRTDEAIALYQDALQLLADVGDRRNVAATLHNLGMLHNARGEHELATDCYERSLPIFREMGLAMEEAKCLNNIGNVHLQRGAAAEAERCYLQTQAIYRELQDRRSQAENLMNLGEIDVELGRFPRAIERHEHALAVHRDLGNRAGVAGACYQLAWANLKLGRLDVARPLVAEALEIDRAIGSDRGRAYDLAAAAFLARLEGDDDRALEELREALEAARAAGDRFHATILTNELAACLAALGRRDEALSESLSARVEASSLGAIAEELASLLGAAENGPRERAEERLRRALALAERVENPEAAWRAWARAAMLRARAGELDSARAAFDRAVAGIAKLARRIGDDASDYLARRDVAAVLDALLELEESAPSPRIEAILECYHLLTTDEARRRARRLVASLADERSEATSELRRLRALREVVLGSDATRPAALLDGLVESVLDLVDAERGLLWVVDPESDPTSLELRSARARGGGTLAGPEREVPRQAVEWVLQEGRGLVTEDVTLDGRLEYRESLAELRVKSLMAAPVRDERRMIGVLYVDRRASGTRFPAAAREDFEGTCRDLGRLLSLALDSERRAEEITRLRERRAQGAAAGVASNAASNAAAGTPGEILPGVIGESEAMRRIAASARVAARSSMSVLLSGESGTGKELLARAIHDLSPRAERAFVALDCGAIPDTLVESILFGHVRGAFTGADRDKAGVFEEADGGTLFLDEIANTSQDLQARLLRVLQEREVRRVGDRGTRSVDVRIIAATNRDLEAEVEAGRFREDLFYRLDVIPIELPPLRDRDDDVLRLAEHFLAQAAERDAKTLEGFDEEATALLAAHEWPGNVRELGNVVARMAAFCDGGTVGAARIPKAIRDHAGTRLELRGAGDDADASTAMVERLLAGDGDFWEVVREPLRERRITKEQARGVIDAGLRRASGRYKEVARLFGLPDSDYSRFMDFLRWSDIKLDFRPYRDAASR